VLYCVTERKINGQGKCLGIRRLKSAGNNTFLCQELWFIHVSLSYALNPLTHSGYCVRTVTLDKSDTLCNYVFFSLHGIKLLTLVIENQCFLLGRSLFFIYYLDEFWAQNV
jgi:hypothetical protein